MTPPTPAKPPCYVTDCVRCGATLVTTTADVTCSCGLQIRIEWMWDGRVEQG
jgi:hypothetical protein